MGWHGLRGPEPALPLWRSVSHGSAAGDGDGSLSAEENPCWFNPSQPDHGVVRAHQLAQDLVRFLQRVIRGFAQRGGAITLTGVHVGALLEQQPERLRVATLNRIGEGAVSGGR